MNDEALEKNYQERLEERVISYIAEKQNIQLTDAMDLYYKSKLADKIAQGQYGIQYLDYKVLGQMILEVGGVTGAEPPLEGVASNEVRAQGETSPSYIITSESCAIDSVNGKFLRDVEPGEIVVITKDGLRSIKYAEDKKRTCIFEYVYFARPDSVIDGISVLHGS